MSDKGASQLPTVAVIGAGLTGLLVAQGLQKNGFKVTVYDKEESLTARAREWTMIVHWAVPVFRALLPEALFKDLRSAYTDPFYPYSNKEEVVPFYNGVTGDVLFTTPAIEIRRFSRTRLRRLCAEGIDIRWGKALVDLQAEAGGPATAVFADGSEARADLVVGCDGGGSRVRSWLLGEAGEARPSEFSSCNAVGRYGDAEKAKFVRIHPINAVAFHPKGLMFIGMQDVEDPDDASTWSFHLVRVWKSDGTNLQGAAALAQFKAETADLAEPFRSAYAWIPDGSPCFTTRLRVWPTLPWDNRGGRVTLAGDAAHSMLPNRGQGLNHALQDAENLVNSLLKVKSGERTVAQTLGGYEAEVVERGHAAVLKSIEDAGSSMKVDGTARHATQGFKK